MRVLGSLLALLLLPTPVLALDPGSAEARGMQMIHDGRIAEGIEALHGNARAHPESRTAQFYGGVGSWWRHLVSLGDERAADEAIAFFKASLRAPVGPADARQVAFESGTAWLLMSHLQGVRGSVLRAALDARKGKGLLDDAKRKDPGNADVGFALGGYDYYADRLPRIMKGIRALLFLPGGNASQGIQELERTARDGRVFSCEASLVLADIYGSSMEDKYVLSIELLDRLVGRHPENPFFLSARAEIESEIGDVAAALRDVAEARRFVAKDDTTLSAGLSYLEARVRDRGFETTAAIRITEPLVASSAGKLSPTHHARMRFRLGEMYERIGAFDQAKAMYVALGKEDLEERLGKKVAKKLSATPDPASPAYIESQPALGLLRAGKAVEAEAELRQLATKYPKDPIPAFFLAEAIHGQGRADAKAAYDEAFSRAKGKPAWVVGWCLVRLGDLEAAEGRREAALHRYNQAARIEHWQGHGVTAYRMARTASLPSRVRMTPAAP